MNRRNFIQTLVSVPLLSQFVLGSKKTQSAAELHLISETPHYILPILLGELRKNNVNCGRTFSLLNHFPEERKLVLGLEKKGWSYSSSGRSSDLLISSRAIGYEIRPSFTMARNGRVWDIRSEKLFPLWKEMNGGNSLSSTLTIASCQGPKHRYAGKSVSIFSQGSKIDDLSLAANKVNIYENDLGRISVSVNAGKVWVNESTCRHKICRLTPPISFAGERIICAPNRFLIEIDRTSLVDTSIG